MVTGVSHGARSSLKVGVAMRVLEQEALSLHKYFLKLSYSIGNLTYRMWKSEMHWAVLYPY